MTVVLFVCVSPYRLSIQGFHGSQSHLVLMVAKEELKKEYSAHSFFNQNCISNFKDPSFHMAKRIDDQIRPLPWLSENKYDG